MLGAWTAVALNVPNCLMTILFMFKDKYKWAKSNIIIYTCILIFILTTIYTWEGFYSLFALFAVIIIVIAKWQDKVSKIRTIALFASIFWILYDYFVGSYGGIVAESIIFLSILISLIFSNKKRIK